MTVPRVHRICIGMVFCILHGFWDEGEHLSAQDRKIDSLLHRADSLRNTDTREAFRLAAQAYEEAQDRKLLHDLAEAELILGACYIQLGSYAEALEHLLRAGDHFSKHNEEDARQRVSKQLGDLYWADGKFEEALAHFQEVYSYGLRKNDSALILDGLISQGRCYGNMNQADTALTLFGKAHNLAVQSGDSTRALVTFFYIGDVFLYSGRAGEALEMFHELEKSLDSPYLSRQNAASLYQSMTDAYLRLGRGDSAAFFASKTAEALVGSREYNRLANLHQALFRIDTLRRNFRSAVEEHLLYQSYRDSALQSDHRKNLANLDIYRELTRSRAEVEELSLENQIKDMQIRQRKILNGTALVVILLLGALVVISVRTSDKIRSQIRQLEVRKVQLEEANGLITLQSKQLQEKNKDLENLIEELRTTQQHLVQSEKMSSLGTLLSGVSHEINNPLNFISGGKMILLESEAAPDAHPREVLVKREMAYQMIDKGLERATEIVKALMTLTDIGSEKKEMTDIEAMINGVLLILTRKENRDVQIERDYKARNRIPAYPQKLQQALINVLENAMQATLEDHPHPRRILVHTKESRNHLIVEISNTGFPVPEANLDRIFDPFFTTKDPNQGKGLGLAIAYAHVDEHYGSIRARNLPDGVQISIELPLRDLD
ncbi:MAG: ATP-binding protein [Bacteroidales bacterium]